MEEYYFVVEMETSYSVLVSSVAVSDKLFGGVFVERCIIRCVDVVL